MAAGQSFWIALTCVAILSPSFGHQLHSCTDEKHQLEALTKAKKLDRTVGEGFSRDETSQDDDASLGLNGTEVGVGKRGSLKAVCCCRQGSSSGGKFLSDMPGVGCRVSCALSGWAFKYSCSCDAGLLCCDCYCHWWYGPVCKQRNVIEYTSV